MSTAVPPSPLATNTPRGSGLPPVSPTPDERHAERAEERAIRRREELREESRAARRGAPQYGIFLPLLLLGIAVVAWSAFQTYQLLREGGQLAGAYAAQEPQVAAALRIRANLDGLAASTQRLANAGNANARTVVDGLRRRGVSINPNPAGGPAPKP